MKKRLTAFFLAFAMLLTLLPTAVLTASAKVYSGTCGAEGDGSNLTWTLDTETGVLEISGTGEMEDNDLWNNLWNRYRSIISTVIIGDGVTSISYGAFCGCTELTSVTIGSGVTSLGEFAFSDCTVLTSVTIPDGVTSIGDKAFGYNYSFETKEYLKVDDFTIYGYNGSVAQTYAEENGFTFIALGDVPPEPTEPTEPTTAPTEPTEAPTEPTEPTETEVPGDLNGDGDVTALDGIRLAKFLVGLVETLRPEPEKAARRAS